MMRTFTRALVVVVFLLCFDGPSFAQLQLAPNAKCPNNAGYCRSTPSLPSDGGGPLNVIGALGNVLYASAEYQTAAHPDCGTDYNLGICLYSADHFDPTENWTYLGKVAGSAYTASYGIASGAGSCSAYKYIYTTRNSTYNVPAHIFRATTDWTNAVDVASGLPNRPPDTTSNANSFVATNLGPNQSRIFFGKYSDGTSSPQTNAQIWYSDDCGNTWTNSMPNPPTDQIHLYSFGCREVHSVAVDPASGWVYANIDCETGSPSYLGLWRSTDGGANFSQVQPGNYGVGIGMVFPRATSKIFMEGDVQPNAPLIYWDKVNGGQIQVAATWPYTFYGEPPWQIGFDIGIKLTSEQNIFVVSGNDGVNNRVGVWYFAPPLYDMQDGLRLEDLQPPIQSIAASNGTATVTFDPSQPNMIQPWDQQVSINGVSPQSFDLRFVTPTIVPGSLYQFTYPCPSCPDTPPTYITGGYVSKPSAYIYLTSEVTDPSTGVAFLYNNYVKIVKPRFLAPTAAAGSALTSFSDSSGINHFIYEGTDGHINDAVWTGGFSVKDTTALSGAPPAASGSPLSSYIDLGGHLHVGYLGTNQHVYQILWIPGSGGGSSYAYNDRTAAGGAPVAAAGSRLTTLADQSWGEHFVYEGTNGHVYDAYWNGSSGFTDLMAVSVAPVAVAGSVLTSGVGSDNYLHIFYIGANQHVYQIFGPPGASWYASEDRTAATGAPTAATGSSLTSLSSGQHLVYQGTNGHVYDAYWTGSYGFTDLTAASGGPVATSGSALSSYVDLGGNLHVVYLGTDQHAYQVLWVPGSGSYAYNDRTAATGAPAAVAGSALNSLADPNWGEHFIYEGANGRIYDAFWGTGGYGFMDLNQ